MMEYEKIAESLKYYMGGGNQISISDTKKLTKTLKEGLENHGPYKVPSYRFNRIALLNLDEKDWNDVKEKLKSQINEKFSELWRISNIKILDFIYKSPDFDSIKDQVDKAIDTGIDGIMLILPNDMAYLYYKLKSYLINNTPSQFMRFDLLSRSMKKGILGFYVDNMLVQFIAKIGGEPWILNMDPEKGSDIIIGTGTTRIENENLFCFAMIFKKDGTMLWNEISPVVKKDKYSKYLKETIEKAVKSFRENNPDWNVEKLTLHVSGKRPKIRDGETEVLKNTIEELKHQRLISQSTKFSILHLNETHPYWIMGNSSNGYHPDEGTKVKLSSKRYLIVLSQPKVTPTKPLSVEIVKHNWTSEEYHHLAQETLNEIYFLSKMSWRGFKGKNLPISVNYPKLVAKIVANVNRYGGDPIHTENNRRLQTTPWFL